MTKCVEWKIPAGFCLSCSILAEYMDPKTLRDRVNDVINTIIRRDDSTKNEEFLQPCIKGGCHANCSRDSPPYLAARRRPQVLADPRVAHRGSAISCHGGFIPFLGHCPLAWRGKLVAFLSPARGSPMEKFTARKPIVR
ncbi:hypothetical protein Dimus_030723 [Dionaea muscipula]